MNANKFFKTELKDNGYSGFKVNIISLSQDFILNTAGKWYKEDERKKDIQNFLLDLQKTIATKNLSELNINTITFNDEFEANTDQKIFTLSGSNFDDLKIHTSNIVGSILYKNHHFNINCRFGNKFLKYMIASTNGFLELEDFGSIDNNLGLGEWILVYYWKLQLKKAFALGLYKTYQHKKKNLSTVRGKVNVNSFLRKGYYDGKTMCNFKEHSYNNDINAIISMAINKTFKKKYQSIVSDIYNIKCAFDSLNLSPVSITNLSSQRVLNPYFKKYNQVVDLSLNLLKDEFANVGDKHADFSAFLFDISLLFEHHVRRKLKQKFKLFEKNKKEFSIPNGIGDNNIYPDIIIDYGNKKVGIYDVKYKHFNFTDGVCREDRFQLVSYVAAHLANYEVIECGVIYPLKELDSSKVSLINQHQTLKICGKELPFKIKFYKIAEETEEQFINDMIFNEQFPVVSPESYHSLDTL